MKKSIEVFLMILAGWGPASLQDQTVSRGFAATAISLIMVFLTGFGIVLYSGIVSVGSLLIAISYPLYVIAGMCYLGERDYHLAERNEQE